MVIYANDYYQYLHSFFDEKFLSIRIISFNIRQLYFEYLIPLFSIY